MIDLEHGILMFIFGVSFTLLGFFIAFLVINYNHRKEQKKKNRPKIYERNPDTGVIRWRYVGESHEEFGWPNYGRILKTK